MTTNPDLVESVKKKSKLNWKIIAPAAALLVGFGAGAASTGSPTTQEAEPEVITETVTETVTETETVEVEVPVEVEVLTVPTSCLVALDDADDLIGVNQDLIGMLSTLFAELPDAMYAAAEWDTAGIERMTGVINGISDEADMLTERVLVNTYWENAEACRLAG